MASHHPAHVLAWGGLGFKGFQSHLNFLSLKILWFVFCFFFFQLDLLPCVLFPAPAYLHGILQTKLLAFY